jgi:hypothetical protein
MDPVILARPTYYPSLTPRFDSNANSGIIRGSIPSDLGKTAIRQYPITPDVFPIVRQQLADQYDIPYQLEKNAPIENEYFSEKIKKSSIHNNKRNMSQMFEQIDPFELKSQDFSKIADINGHQQKQVSSRPDLSYAGAQLPKLGIDNKFKDPTNPSNYMYDRTLFAPLKRRYGNVQTDYIRGDVYVAPNKFGWFDVPSNPGTDLNPGFFNLNYPSFQSHVENQDLKVERENKSLTMADLESIQQNNPFSTNFRHRP